MLTAFWAVVTLAVALATVWPFWTWVRLCCAWVTLTLPEVVVGFVWAALTCRLAQAAQRSLGLVQVQLYAGAQAGQAAPGFRDITSGNNGAYSAGPGWDACTGLGSPNGPALLALVTAPAGAGSTAGTSPVTGSAG